MPKKRIAYVMSRFPFLPETFILREMNEMENQGWEIDLFPLINQTESVQHAEGLRWENKAYRMPLFSIEILVDFSMTLFSRPSTIVSIFFTILRENIRDFNFLIKSLAFFPKSVHLARVIRKRKIEHIHAHYATYPALTAWIIHRLTGIPFSVTVHAHDIFEGKSMLEVKLKDAKWIIAISAFNRQYLIDTLGEGVSEKIHVIHCGIRPEDYARPSDAIQSDGRLKIVHIGSLQPYKGQKYLVEACRLLRQKGIPFQALLIGAGTEKANLEDLISLYGLNEEVRLLGAKTQEEVADLLPSGNCYAQPSIIMPAGTMEGIPVALMEAMACGLPVVASAISGIPELVQDQVSGYLVPPEDAEELARVLIRIYENRSEAEGFASLGQENVLREFNLHINVGELSELFQLP